MQLLKKRQNLFVYVTVLFLVAIHLLIVSSILFENPSIIWPLHNDTIHRVGPAADFYGVYHAGVNVSRGFSPYATAPDGITPNFYAFRYLPILAIAAQLFTLASPQVAYIFWIVILEGILALLIGAIWRKSSDPRVSLTITAALLLNSPYFLEIYMGQFTFVSIALCCLALMVRSNVPMLCASILVKPIGLAALPAFALHRSLRPAVAYALPAVLLLSFPHFVRHPDQWSHFFASNFELSGGLDPGNYGFLRFLHLVVTDVGLDVVLQSWLFFVSTFRFLVFSGTLLVLTYQHVWEHHITAVCVLAATCAANFDARDRTSRVALISLVVLALPTPYVLFDAAKNPAVWDPSLNWPRYADYVIVLFKVAPTVALFVAVMRELTRKGLMSLPEAIKSARSGT
jgi:hypothetical protein